jgi:hypothetical protein
LFVPLKPLDRESEPYSQYGNISADGIQRLLGAPNLNALQILIRETVQNSWDAGKDIPGPIGYRLRFRELSKSEHKSLREVVFDDLPNYTENPERPIKKTLNRKKLNVIEICDFGTTGLAGPTHPDVVPKDNESADFVDFLRNIGSPRDTVFGGGTYGYGKSCLYAISQCQTIVVDSATTNAGKYTRRFMACRIASRYDIVRGPEKGRYTGRHWWGRKTANSHLDPSSDDEADKLSESLGMYPRDADTLGTSIMIVDPELDSDDLAAAAQSAIRILLWYCWPKIVARSEGDSPPMEFSVEVNGKQIPVPHPSECPPLNLFANSLAHVRNKSEDSDEIRSQRPNKKLGHIHITQDLKMDRLPGFSNDDGLYPDYSSHVALMRPAELVVKYLIGDRLPSENAEWGGVFLCSDEKEVEQAFAAAEPPAHDDWDPRSLPRGEKKTYVRGALQRIKKRIAEVTGTLPTNPDDGGERCSLGLVADSLGSLLGAGEGQRLGTRESTRKKTGPTRAIRISLSRPKFVGHETIGQKNCALFELSANSMKPVDIRIDGVAKIAKDGGGADTTDSRGLSAKVVSWRSDNGDETEGPNIEISLNGEEKLTAIVEIPHGKAVSFNASYEELK